MTEREIAQEFMRLFCMDWEDSAAHQGFRNLHKRVARNGQWPKVIEARLMVLEKKTAESIALLKKIRTREPRNPYASLLLAFIFYREGEPEEALAIYDFLINKGFRDQELPDWLEALTLRRKGDALGEMGKSEDAIQIYDEVTGRFGEADELPLREQVALAMVNKGVTIGRMGKPEEEIQIWDEVIRRFGEADELPLREQVALAMLNKGVAIGRMGKPEDAIQIYHEVIQRFGKAHELPLREQVALAMLYKTDHMLDSNRGDEARELFTAVDRDYLISKKLRSNLAPQYDYLLSRFASKKKPGEDSEEARLVRTALQSTSEDLWLNLKMYLTVVLANVPPETQGKYFKKIEDAEKQTTGFIKDKSRLASDLSFLLVLREWNSYTPVIPKLEESDRGGGYFIKHAGEGIVIDPGYDFIENFYTAGGLLCDIDHIIVTHAHDDHTAELEALLMLLNRRWTTKNPSNRKKVSLCLSAGVQRKFAGLLDLKDPKYKRIITLCPSEKGLVQRVRINPKTTLTVLPAYHDDVITQDTAVGLGFEFRMRSGTKKVVFTGDSGLFPVKRGEDGEKRVYDGNEETPMLDVSDGKALYARYPKRFHNPDLLVAHIGSIKRNEFPPGELPTFIKEKDDIGRWFYVNHLGLLGTLIMLHQLYPKAAVISEFGSELKGFHVELVRKLTDALHDRQRSDSKSAPLTFVIPGDLTIAYSIEDHRFLCHDDCEFADPADLCFRTAVDCEPKLNVDTAKYQAETKTNTSRTYLFRQNRSPVEHEDNSCAQEYYRRVIDRKLPYHKK